MAEHGGKPCPVVLLGTIMEKTIAAGASRQVAAAVAAALGRLAIGQEGGTNQDEVAERLAAIRPVIAEKVTAAADRRDPRLCGSTKARRNVAEHIFGDGTTSLLRGSGARAKQAQRGGRSNVAREGISETEESTKDVEVPKEGTTASLVPENEQKDGSRKLQQPVALQPTRAKQEEEAAEAKTAAEKAAAEKALAQTKEHDTALADLQAELESARGDLVRMREQNTTQEEELEAARGDLARLREQTTTQDEKVVILNKLVDTLKQQLEAAQGDLVCKCEQYTIKEKEVETTTRLVDKLKQQVAYWRGRENLA